MNKVTEFLFENRKQKGDGTSCRQFNTIPTKDTTKFNKTVKSDKMISKQEAEQSLQDHVNSLYTSINSSQPKELTSDGYKLSGYSDSQCKSNKIQYKTNCSTNNDRNNYNSMVTTTDAKDLNRQEKDDVEDSYVSDTDSTDSDFSNLSGLSDLSGQEWKPITKSITWVQRQINSGVNPRDILSHFLSNGATISPNLNDMSLWRILASILAEPPRRQKLRHINTIDDVVRLLKESKNIIVLTGAGVSVSCGIPDFRSNDGIYSRLAKDFPDLPDPQAMFDINYFSRDPRPFYKFAREIYPGQFTPSPCHRFIKLLEKKQKLLRNYTQNIDTLEQVAGIHNVIECHGSFATASCTKCKYKTTADAIREDIFAQKIPLCPKCHPSVISEQSTKILTEPVSSYSDLVQSGIMKPDIVFFGEGLPDAFHSAMAGDKDKCDLLIVIGSSLKVRPVALIPSSIPGNVPQILINREQLNHLEFDVELLGDSDIVINQLCHLLGDDWTEICWDTNVLMESKHLKPNPMIPSNVHVSAIDTDSQSTKSAITTNSSSGAFCDSGFESSSSLHATTQNVEIETPQQRTDDDRIILFGTDSSNCSSSGCQTDHFVKLQKKLNLRHLSVDSSKDSGICDSSNSVPLSGCTNLHIQQEDEEEEEEEDVDGDYDDNTGEVDDNTDLDRSDYHPRSHSNRKISRSSPSTSYMSLTKPISLAERLQENTYYYNSSTSSYVFPGAQVYWSSDSEYEEDDGDEDDDIVDDNDDHDGESGGELNTRQIDLSTSGELKDKPNEASNQNDNSDDDSPPNKRRRDFFESETPLI